MDTMLKFHLFFNQHANSANFSLHILHLLLLAGWMDL